MKKTQKSVMDSNSLHTVTVGIPAYNEEGNILNLIYSILKQKTNTSVIKEILIITDGCTDNTINEAAKATDCRIKIIDGKTREGKSKRLNDIFKYSSSESIVLVDADTYLHENAIDYLIKKLSNDNNIGLVGGNPTPIQAANHNMVNNAIAYSVLVTQSIRKKWKEGSSVYCFNGRLIAIKKELAKKLTLPSTAGNDAFIYFKARELGYRPAYEEKAVSYFYLPRSFKDHSKQSLRFSQAKRNMKKYFSNELTSEYDIDTGLLLVESIRSFSKAPLGAITYLCFQLINSMYIYNNVLEGDKWDISNSTKKNYKQSIYER